MQAAFFLGLVFPPPAAGAFRLARRDGAGAGRAADRDKAFLVQNVDWNFVFRAEIRDVLARKIEQWARLDQAASLVNFDEARAGSMRRLIGAQSGDPDFRAGQRASQRLDLARSATRFARFERVVKSIDALVRDQLLQGRGVGIESADAKAIFLFGARPDVVGFGKQSPGVEGDDFDVDFSRAESMGDGLVLDPETGGEDDAARRRLP